MLEEGGEWFFLIRLNVKFIFCFQWSNLLIILHRAIKYHRAMGVIFWIFATLHMLLYEIKWLQSGVLIQNAWSEVLLQFYLLLPLACVYNLKVRQNNWLAQQFSTSKFSDPSSLLLPPHNCLLFQPNNWIVEGTADEPLKYRNSNWTISLMEFTYALNRILPYRSHKHWLFWFLRRVVNHVPLPQGVLIWFNTLTYPHYCFTICSGGY